MGFQSNMLVRMAASQAADPEVAVAELWRDLALENPALVIFFASARYDIEHLGSALARYLGDVDAIGCTSAGEIGPCGYQNNGLVGLSLSRDVVDVVVGEITDLNSGPGARGREAAHQLRAEFERRGLGADPSATFAFLLVDGLSVSEESLAWAIQKELDSIPLVGGSAGDDLKFERTWVYHAGRFISDAAVLALVRSKAPVQVFKTQHFVPSDDKLVVTEASPEARTVSEINGLPAAAEFARIVGVDPDDLTPMSFAAHPVVVKIGDSDYVRSIQKVNPDGSLTFYCAIDEGLVLTVARGIDMVQDLANAFDKVRAAVGKPLVTLSCDCILRNLELLQGEQITEIEALLSANNAMGFSTYGEQFRGMHVNQTLTAVAIGNPVKGD